MDGCNTNYSRAEWGSLSIQDRMRAMKETLNDEDEEGNPVCSQAQGTTMKDDSMMSEETADAPARRSGRSGRSSRSSVIDMWRKREESSLSQGSGTPKGKKPRPVASISPSPRKASYNFEEKKEPTPEEDPAWNASQNLVFNTVTPEKSKNERQSSFRRPEEETGAPKAQEEEEKISSTSPSEDATVCKGKKRWSKPSPSHVPSFFADLNNAQRQSPVVSNEEHRQSSVFFNEKNTLTNNEGGGPEVSSEPPSSPIKSATSPAFSDMRAKFANFAAQKEQKRESFKRVTSPKVDSPRVSVGNPWSPRSTDSLKNNPDSTSDRIHQDSVHKVGPMSEVVSKADISPIEPKQAAGLRREKLLKKHLVKSGQKYAARPKAPLSSEENSDKSLRVSNSSGRASIYNSLRVVTTGLDSSKSVDWPTPADEDDEPGHIVSKLSSPTGSARSMTRTFNKKAMLEKHRRRSGKTSETKDDKSMTSDSLSDVFSDTVPGHLSQKLSAQLTNFRSPTALSKGNAVPMSTLLACGANEEALARDPAYRRKPDPPSPITEYSSLRVSDSTSFLMPDGSRSTHSARRFINEQSSMNHDGMSDAGLSEAQSLEGSLFSERSGSTLASRAAKQLREKRQRTQIVQSADMQHVPSGSGRLSRTTLSPRKSPYHHTNPVTSQPNKIERNATSQAREVADPSIAATLSPAHLDNSPDVFDFSNVGAPLVLASARRQATSAPGVTPVTNLRAPSFSSETTATNTMNSTVASETASRRGRRSGSRTPRGLERVSQALVKDEFITESNTNVEAFKSTFQALSLEQIAKDLKDDIALTVPGLDFKKLATDLNQGMTAASESLNKLVGKNVFSTTPRNTPRREPSPIEEIAIEVEYFEGSDDEGSATS